MLMLLLLLLLQSQALHFSRYSGHHQSDSGTEQRKAERGKEKERWLAQRISCRTLQQRMGKG